MKGRHYELPVSLVVDETGADQSLVSGFEHVIVQGFLEGEGLGLPSAEAVSAKVDGQPEPVSLGGVGKTEMADIDGQVGRIAFLQAEHIRAEFPHEFGEFAARMVLAQVVADDSDHVDPARLAHRAHQSEATAKA